MNIFLGVLLIVWGSMVLYSSLFNLKNKEYKDKGVLGVSGYIELEFLLKLLNKLPLALVKAVIVIIGLTFIITGIVIF
ncbi:hypothetical protein GCM10008967_09710 [Bacillus carboniphilus]|uniref:Uncharacterized protein n=1 Tax=Bacillus carboniphilus TaxID=86663 RepID=A0ABN0VZN4_9BACI